jgi:two-component system sensor histidine kinase YesM
MAYDGDDLTIYMEDSGGGMTDEDLEGLNRKLSRSAQSIEDTTGLINVHRRIQIKYGTDYGLSMSRSELGGLRAAIRLSLKEGVE